MAARTASAIPLRRSSKARLHDVAKGSTPSRRSRRPGAPFPTALANLPVAARLPLVTPANGRVIPMLVILGRRLSYAASQGPV